MEDQQIGPIKTQSPGLALGPDIEQSEARTFTASKNVDQLPRARQVEVGIIRKVSPLHIVMFWEDYPSWLPGIDPNRCKTLTLVGFRSSQQLLARCENTGHGTTLLRRCLVGLGERLRYIDKGEVPSGKVDLVLVAGSLPYLVKQSHRVGTYPACFLLDEHFSGRLCTRPIAGVRTRFPRGMRGEPHPGMRWQLLKHEHFGGPSSYRCLLGTINTRFEAKTTHLRRTLGHFLSFGVRPKPLGRSTPSQAYTLTSILDPQCLSRPVVYATHFYASGWGIRPLDADELGTALGLSLRLRGDILDIAELIFCPIQILDGVLDGFVELSAPTTITERAPAHRRPDLVHVTTARTWLPDIKRFITREWIDLDLVTSKAAKGDDAAVPTGLWDKRVSLVFPAFARALGFLRSLAIRWMRRHATLGLRRYLRRTYGAGWHKDLQLIRRNEHRLGARKRTVGGGPVFSPARVSALRKLERDADVGIDVLARFANASFMEWDAGSTLVFWRWGSPSLQAYARDGMEAFVDPYLPLPRKKKPASRPPSTKYKLYLVKLRKIIQRGYVKQGKITGLTDYFGVDKADDIRMVYNGSSCGLNKSLWAPNF
jgi:hypothetical protein